MTTSTEPPIVSLARLAEISSMLADAEQEATDLRMVRDAMIIALAERGTPHAQIAEAADVGVKAIGNHTRAAGLRRYRPRGSESDSAAPGAAT